MLTALTNAQESFLKTHADNDFLRSLANQLKRGKLLSENQIAALERAMERHANPPAKLTIGVYEVDGAVYVVKPNKEDSRMYAKRIQEINGDRLLENGEVVQFELIYEQGAIYNIKPEYRVSFERAKELALRYAKCLLCGRGLKAAKSVEQMFGPICIKALR